MMFNIMFSASRAGRVLAAAVLLHPAFAVATEALQLEASAPEAGRQPLEHGKAATADASPVDPGAFEVEVAWAPVWIEAGGARGFDAAGEGYTHTFSTALTYGLVPDLDAHVAGGFAATFDGAADVAPGQPRYGQGLTDLALGARWRFLRSSELGLEVAATGELVMPVGAGATATQRGITQDYWSARAGLVATADRGRFTLNGELAACAPVAGDAGGLQATLHANAAVGLALLTWLQPELELNAHHELGTSGKVLAATAGVVVPFGAHRVIAAVQRAIVGQHAAETTSGLLAFKTSL